MNRRFTIIHATRLTTFFLPFGHRILVLPQVEMPHKAEIVTSLKGTVIRCAEESADMYKSIDEVCDRLVS